MYRTLIPKPKKPGEFRPITQPADKDRLVLHAMALVLRDELEPVFLRASQGGAGH